MNEQQTHKDALFFMPGDVNFHYPCQATRKHVTHHGGGEGWGWGGELQKSPIKGQHNPMDCLSRILLPTWLLKTTWLLVVAT